MLFSSLIQVTAIVVCHLLSDISGEDVPSADILCKRDVLLILDTSYSVGRTNFEQQVKPFLEELVMDKDLNVHPNGTQVSLMVFSDYSGPWSGKTYRAERDKTQVLVHFKDKYDAKTLKDYINNLQWENVRGGRTRTDIALKIANTEIFPDKSPFNNRQMSSDIIILITDGKPHGVHRAPKITKSIAEELKAKGITIIGVGVGKQIENPKFWSVLKKIASPGQAIRKKFKDLKSIRKWLERKSCGRAGSRCVCPEIRYAPYYLKQNEASTSISWLSPSPVCVGEPDPNVLKTVVEPAMTSPQNFKEGQHSIHYKFFLRYGSQIDCFVNIEVKAACPCLPSKIKPVQVLPGKASVMVQWYVPVPSCLNYKKVVAWEVLPIGIHSMGYTYSINPNLNVTCKVKIQVKGWLCSNMPYNDVTQVCCSGIIHDKKTNYKCCGHHYFDTTQYKCCNVGLNVREEQEACPVNA